MADLREGLPEDASTLARVFLDSAVAGFSSFLPADFDWPSLEAVEERTRRAINEEGVGIFVAEEAGGVVVGYVGHSLSRDPDWFIPLGEVRTMFVQPSAWGTGVADALLERALEALSESYEEATVWSFVANERANAFYEAQGFTRDGARRREAVWADIEQVRYRVRLPSADDT